MLTHNSDHARITRRTADRCQGPFPYWIEFRGYATLRETSVIKALSQKALGDSPGHHSFVAALPLPGNTFCPAGRLGATGGFAGCGCG